MSNLFDNLPQVLQDHIHSYNVKHRETMKEICIELLYELEEIECSNYCGMCIRRLDSIHHPSISPIEDRLHLRMI